jgi:hypothetical protein
MRTLDPERVQNGDRTSDTRGQRIRGRLVRLVASTLAAVVGQDQPVLAAQRLGEARGLRDVQRISEAGVKRTGEPAPPSSSKCVRTPSTGFVAYAIGVLPLRSPS